MDFKPMKAISCPTDTLAYTNRAIISATDSFANHQHVEIVNSSNKRFVFTIVPWNDPNNESGYLGFNMPMRKWAMLSTNERIQARPFQFDARKQSVAKITLYIEYMQKSVSADTLNSDELAKEFSQQFTGQAFTEGQIMVFKFQDKKLLKLTVKDMEALNTDIQGTGGETAPRKITIGVSFPNTQVFFEKSPDSAIQLIGSSKGTIARPSIINPDWNFEQMGIGGLDTEFSAIFRRAFASRVFPPELIDELGIKHVRGILLFGPPGTGKTLMARQIGKMLNAREPKIVNGPQILDKYVGESEANIRKLFEDAEEEQKKMGINSGLHIIIFDEIDAICKARGSTGASAGVHDTVVNQLLSKIDGVDSLNNILVIGMTNRRDMIDEALLRPGRLEVQMEISLPDEHGRLQIINIHTTKMRQFKKLADDVNLKEIAQLTKNFSGAEIEGLVRAAQSTAMNRLVKATSKVELDPKAIEKLRVTREDFLHALEYDIKPAFGTNSEAIERLISCGIVLWSPLVNELLEDGRLFMEQVKSEASSRGIISVLLEGAPNSGKSGLAARLAIDSDFPFVKLCSPDDMVGFTENAKCMAIRKVFDDAYKSTLSVIVVDNIERLLDYGPIGPRYSNYVLQALMVLLKKEPPPGRRLMVLCTTSCRQVLDDMGLLSTFTSVLHCPNLTQADHLCGVLQEVALDNGSNNGCFTQNDVNTIVRMIQGRRLSIGIKKLIGYIDHARQMEPSVRARKFLLKLEEEGAVYMQ